MSASDLEPLRGFDSPAARRVSDISSVLTVLIGNTQPHNRGEIERLAREVFEATLAFFASGRWGFEESVMNPAKAPAPDPDLLGEMAAYHRDGRGRKTASAWRCSDGLFRGFRGDRQTEPFATLAEALAAANKLENSPRRQQRPATMTARARQRRRAREF